jgi:hypothetical protein
MRKFFALVEIEVADDQGVNEMERNNVINAPSLVWRLDLAAQQCAEKRCADDLLIEGTRGVPSVDTLCGPIHLFDQVFLCLCDWPSIGRRRHSSFRDENYRGRLSAYTEPTRVLAKKASSVRARQRAAGPDAGSIWRPPSLSAQ